MSRYKYGVVSIRHKGKDVTTSVGSVFDESVATADDKVHKTARLIHLHEGRPDVLSFILYDNSEHWWVIQHANNISDPLQEMIEGTTIKLPNV